MIKVENLSFAYPQKDLFDNISFHIEENQHCALIGTNGTGKSTLLAIILNPETYMFHGKLEISEQCRIGYVSQFLNRSNNQDSTVFEYISEEFVRLQNEINTICMEMETALELESFMERYQFILESFDAVDGNHYESNIKKKLALANLSKKENLRISELSSGEFKLIQVIKEMITNPTLMIMDEPDVFLDFGNLNGLRDLINSHKGSMLVITHNRYLLNHCFHKILHLENTEMQEWDGSYMEYNFSLLCRKIELQEMAIADREEIERNKQVVDKLRKDATVYFCASRGRSLHARVSLLERLEARKIKDPFVMIKQPQIHLATTHEIEESTALQVKNYSIQFDEILLDCVEFAIKANEKVAIVGPNGTGKTTLLCDIYQNENKAIEINPNMQMAYLSQRQGEMLKESNTVLEEFYELGYEKDKEIGEYLAAYGFTKEELTQTIEKLSGGEKSLLQLAKIAASNANLLLLDEPTSDLDIYAQIALEKAIADYNGTILMVSHDFYTIVNCMDYVLWMEDKTIRKMSIRKFRQMIYAKHFDKDYLEIENKKKDLEIKIAYALQEANFKMAKVLCEQLETSIQYLVGKK